MGNKLNECIVTVVQTIASDIRVKTESKKVAEEKGWQTESYQRENHRVVSKYCKAEKVEPLLTNEDSDSTLPKGVEHE